MRSCTVSVCKTTTRLVLRLFPVMHLVEVYQSNFLAANKQWSKNRSSFSSQLLLGVLWFVQKKQDKEALVLSPQLHQFLLLFRSPRELHIPAASCLVLAEAYLLLIDWLTGHYPVYYMAICRRN